MADRDVFKRGDRVFLASGGVGVVADFAARDARGRPAPWTPEMGPPVFYVVSAGEVTACVPIATSESGAGTLRRLVSPEVASQMLAQLRAESFTPTLSAEGLLERGKQVVHSGTPLEHAALLRELYALPAPVVEPLGEGMDFLARLVLTEIAIVLGLESAQLHQEMRSRYPAAAEWAERRRGQIGFKPDESG